jgi:hypothetical protein
MRAGNFKRMSDLLKIKLQDTLELYINMLNYNASLIPPINHLAGALVPRRSPQSVVKNIVNLNEQI